MRKIHNYATAAPPHTWWGGQNFFFFNLFENSNDKNTTPPWMDGCIYKCRNESGVILNRNSQIQSLVPTPLVHITLKCDFLPYIPLLPPIHRSLVSPLPFTPQNKTSFQENFVFLLLFRLYHMSHR